MFLKGLGLKITLLNTEKAIVLSFKLGLSHSVSYPVPKHKILCYLQKNNLIFTSFDSAFLGNCCKNIKNFKPINIYTGKGFWYKDEKVKLKKFKKIKKKLKK